MEGKKEMNKTWNLKEMKKLIPLALPVLVVNLSIVGMGAVDAIVAGRAGVTDMAAVALGSSVYLPVALFACGVLMIGAGCGAATAVIFYIEFLLMFLLVYLNPKHRPYRRHIVSWRRPTPSVITHLMRLGVPIGVSQLCEVMLFCAAALVLAPLGETQVASHQIAGNVGGLVFMLPLSVGLAASIRVAYHHGRKDLAGTKSAVLSSYVLVLTICLCTFGGITLFREQIVHLYNDSEMIVSTASVLLILAAAYQLPDCLQVLSVGVLRGFRDTASITVITFFSYWIVGFPVCYILARTNWIVPAMGARGIWIGFIIGLSVAAVLLLWRVRRTTRREFALMRQEGE